jgi:uncharacterized protein (DUF4415 family)
VQHDSVNNVKNKQLSQVMKAYNASLTKEQRTKSAVNAATKRWAKATPEQVKQQVSIMVNARKHLVEPEVC